MALGQSDSAAEWGPHWRKSQSMQLCSAQVPVERAICRLRAPRTRKILKLARLAGLERLQVPAQIARATASSAVSSWLIMMAACVPAAAARMAACMRPVRSPAA